VVLRVKTPRRIKFHVSFLVVYRQDAFLSMNLQWIKFFVSIPGSAKALRDESGVQSYAMLQMQTEPTILAANQRHTK
jgi:hypothetical protein